MNECKSHQDLVNRLDSLDKKIDEGFNSVLKVNGDLCQSIIDLNKQETTSKVSLSKSKLTALVSIVGAISGMLSTILVKYFG